MIQLTIKEAMSLLREVDSCNSVLHRCVNNTGVSISNLGSNIEGNNDVKTVLYSISEKFGAVADYIYDDSAKIWSFAESQFESYITKGNVLTDKLSGLCKKCWSLCESVETMGEVVGGEFVTLTTQNVGNAEVGFMKNSAGQSQKVVM